MVKTSTEEALLTGKEILQNFEAEGKYVFHGSEVGDLKVLEPRQAQTVVGKDAAGESIRENDDDPGIHASPFIDIAIFMAIISQTNCPQGYENGFDYDDKQKKVFFHTDKKTLMQLNENSKGYVYVFLKKDFTQRSPSQSISYEPVKPFRVIEVGIDDLPHDIEIRDAINWTEDSHNARTGAIILFAVVVPLLLIYVVFQYIQSTSITKNATAAQKASDAILDEVRSAHNLK